MSDTTQDLTHRLRDCVVRLAAVICHMVGGTDAPSALLVKEASDLVKEYDQASPVPESTDRAEQFQKLAACSKRLLAMWLGLKKSHPGVFAPGRSDIFDTLRSLDARFDSLSVLLVGLEDRAGRTGGTEMGSSQKENT